MSASKRGHDYEELFHRLLQHSVDGVVLNDRESRRILEVSDSFCALTGHDRAELVGRTSVELGLVDPDEVRDAATAQADLGIEGLYETHLHRADGEERWVEFSHQVLGDALVLTIARDATSRHRLEERLLAAKEDAERAWTEADAANRAKSEFLSRMSHELRTPLHAVLGFAEMLELDPVNNDQREAIEHILKGGHHLLGLINEVLDISRIETGDLALSSEAVSVVEVTGEALDLVRPIARQRSIAVFGPTDASCEQYVFADRQRLEQILLNLLTNAVKYNRLGGSIWLSCEVHDRTRLRIKVTDTGPGLDPDQVARLFVFFERLGAQHTEIEGTGMGLALSQRLAEAMGGTLAVETKPGAGSTFWVELQIVEEPVHRYDRLNGDAQPTGTDTPANAVRTVLYIEDNLANLKLAERIFARRADIDVIPAMQGRLGLTLAREHRPGLILLDLHLPDVSGEEVLQHLRDDPATAAIPVVILSVDATPGQIQRLLTAGATGYLTKPFDVQELLALLDDQLGAG